MRKSERKQTRGMWAMKNFLRVVICVAAALIVAGLIWTAAKPFVRKSQWRKGLEQMGSSTSSGALTFLPQYENGSGQAGVALQLPEMRVTFDTPGWQHGDEGWWYACDVDTCYANGWVDLDGNRYHFDQVGYMDCDGWVPIGGKGYYFDERGIYQADRDSSRMVALTFDDGPGEYTNQLLDVLEENHAAASFMMLGSMVEQYGAETIPRMVQLGCTIGNHSYDHADLEVEGREVAREQFSMTDAAIAAYNDGEGAAVIRFPYGNYTKEEAEDTGRPCIYWNSDTVDWNKTTPAELKQVILDNIEGGSILLMHDIYENTVQACAEAIPELMEMGYELVTVETLAAARGVEMKPGVTYFGFTDREIANGIVSDE